MVKVHFEKKFITLMPEITTQIKIIIADDHPLFRGAISRTIADLINSEQQKTTVFEAQSVDDVYRLLEKDDDFDLVLLDVHFPGTNGLAGLANLRGCFPLVPIAMITGSDSSDIVALSEELGASGFLSKSDHPEVIAQAINALLIGDNWFPDIGAAPKDAINREVGEVAEKIASLTPAQFKIFTLVCEGLLNKQIAYELDITENTVKTHLSNIFAKFNVRKRTSLIILANLLNSDNNDDELIRAEIE